MVKIYSVWRNNRVNIKGEVGCRLSGKGNKRMKRGKNVLCYEEE